MLTLGTSAAWTEEGKAAEGRTAFLEEIVVTGTKRAVAQQETPIAISTITAADIARTFGNDIRALGDLSPNVTLTNQTGFNALAGGIRGTGTISILTTQDPSVGLLVDEFALNHVQSQFVELFDLEQVEIYRGPQGTLFGKNSTGGVIAIRSKRPDLAQFNSDLKVSFGEYDGGASARKLQAAVDVPLVEGQLGLRFAGSYTDEQGYYTNDKATATFPNSPLYQALGITPAMLPPELGLVTTGAGERLGGKQVFAAKTKLLWQPNDRYEGYFIWEIVRDDSDSPPGINETPGGEGFLLELLGFPGNQVAGNRNPFSTGMTQQGNGINIRDGHRVDIDGFYFNQSLAFDRFTLHSNTGYREQMETLPSTYTGEAFISLFDATRNLEREQFQQELRLVTNFDGPFNFVVGGIYLLDDLDFRAYSTVGLTSLFPVGLNPALPFFDDRGFVNMDLRALTNDPGTGRVEQKRNSLAFYVDGTWDINDRWSLSAGARYTEDEKEFYKPTGGGGPCNQYTDPRDAVRVNPDLPFDPVSNCAADLRSGMVSRAGITGAQVSQRRIPLPDSAFRFIADEKRKWTETTWRAALDYAIADQQMAYLSVATGFLSGGFSETCSQEATCIPYDPETNINFEVGYKADLLDRRLRLNLAVFHTRFKDLQRNQVFAFTNADGSPGQETITLNAGKSHATGFEIESTWLATDRLQFKGSIGYLNAEYDEFEFDPDPTDDIPPVDLSGLSIPFSPKLQAALEASFDQSLPNGGSLLWIVGAHYQDEAETSPFDPNAAAQGIARHPTFTQMEERTLINANVTYQSPDERYYLTAFGRNLTNEKYRVTANSVGALWNFTMYGAPRMLGVEFGVNFR